MADFDQLIKEKAEQAEYSYKHSAWKSFAKSAGIKAGLSGLQIAAITVAVVAVVTGITLGVVFSGQPVPSSEQGTVARIQDTVETQHAASPIQDEQGAVDSVQGTVETCHGASLTRDNRKVQAPVDTPRASSQPNVNRQRPAYGRPLEILVDTITEMEPTDEQLRQGNSRIF